MTANHVATHHEVVAGFKRLGEALPDPVTAFHRLHRAAMRAGALDESTKELIALAIGVTSGCDRCVSYHVHDALRAGATRDEIVEALGVAVFMGGAPAAVQALDAIEAIDQFDMAGVDPR